MGGRLEVCIDSVESAVLAWEGGADGLEVCSNLIIGGTTPGVSQFKQIRQACDIELTVLIRPRFGDFLYTDAEFKMMKEDIRIAYVRCFRWQTEEKAPQKLLWQRPAGSCGG